MTLVRRLAEHVLENHPGRAATALERLGEEEAVGCLASGSLESAASILRRLSPQYVEAVLRGVDPKRVARMLEKLPNDARSRIVRRAEDATRASILEQLPQRASRSIRTVLEFPEGSAGALMDPEVMALPQELNAREALQRVRKAPENSRYNVYVVDQEQRLVGAINLRELLIARSRFPLSDLMIRDPHRLPAHADRATVIAHPGWKEVHALPVVDGSDAYLGAIRYRVLRRLEEDLLTPPGNDMDTGAAFGQVISAGVIGVLDALSGSAPGGQRGKKSG